MKRSTKSGVIEDIMTVYYENKDFTGKTKNVYSSF